MIDKFVRSAAEALDGVPDGATVLLAGFGDVGMPMALLEGLIEQGAKDLVLVCNSGGRDGSPVARLLTLGRVRKLVCTFIRAASDAGRLLLAGKLEVEVIPQGTLAERLRAAGAGIPAFYTPTAADTVLAEGREVRDIGGRRCLLEYPLPGDVALIDAWQADRWGNLTYRDTQRNFNPVMAMAAPLTVVQTRHVVELGAIPPEQVITSGIFVNRVLHVPG
ncbi:MAG: 3-oxoacid CoA-transferase subunit A [Rhodospirillales bacterium]|jgi:3-oxoadipate CoA-transferase alpha subunit|nr:3-oxoacid CoA-transferase subunit A [Rhodospirillales bacterium]